MANSYFTCILNATVSGNSITSWMNYKRSGSYFYQDTSFPTPTLTIAGTNYSDTGFRDTVRNGVYVGNVDPTHYTKSGLANGTYTVSFSAGSGQRSDFAGSWSNNTIKVNYYTAPSGISGTNNTTDGTEGKAKVTVSVSNWGNGCSASTYYASKSSKSTTSYWKSGTSGTLEFTGLAASTSTTAGAITTWYPTAKNNQGLSDGAGAKYIVSPSAPIIANAGTTTANTDPKCILKGTCTYKGGETNSSSADTATMNIWRLYAKPSDGSYGTPQSKSDTAANRTFDAIASSSFTMGKNYTFKITATNKFGAYSSSETTVYCPTGVSATANVNEVRKITWSCSATNAGTMGAAAGGTMACYEVKYSTDKTTVDNGGGTSTGKVASSSISATGLGVNTTYYYRVYGWNIFGLSQVSGTLSAKTKALYDPTISSLTTAATGMGANVTATVGRTGGDSENAATVTSAKLEGKFSSTSSWTTLETKTVSLKAGNSVTFSNKISGKQITSGNYDFRVTFTTNAAEANTVSSTTTINAPAAPTFLTYGLYSDSPTQFVCNASTTSAGSDSIYQWQFYLTNGTVAGPVTSSTSTSISGLVSAKNLLYNTTYTDCYVVAVNKYGLWNKSSNISLTTAPRIKWYVARPNKTSDTTPVFKSGGVEYKISEVYYVVKDALGNMKVGDNMKYKRLTFIQDKVWYRPENVASINLSNGKKIAYALDSDGTYKFGIWNGNTLETTFYNGNAWVVTKYEFPSTSVTISSLTNTGKGMNSSSLFSTTKCEDIPLWERK